MRFIIAGSRGITDINHLWRAIDHLPNGLGDISSIVSGGARGADKLGERLAKSRDIPLTVKPAEWDKYGKSAGYRRNAGMAEDADALIALWDGKSKGTTHMINLATEKGLLVYVYNAGSVDNG